jgi:2-polyprenyl-6-methoxyphenol hydroxylase-like FAD-dependent oxidoreductase
MRDEETEVLVVGAGPVGLLTAIALADAGIQVKIIDQEERTAARSYACALHPQTLKLLAQLKLAQPLVERGRRVETVALYDGAKRQAEVRLAGLGGEFPFLVILPQNVLEEALEQRLRQAGVKVHWGHRFDDVRSDTEGISATVEELGATGTGYIVPHWEAVVQNRFPVRARFLVGADGHASLVRQRLGLEQTQIGEPAFFAVCEFEPEVSGESEVRVVLDDHTTNVLWPLRQDRCRWTLQVLKTEPLPEFPDKERRGVRLAQKETDARIRRYVETVAHERAPWFQGGVKEITWATEVVFGQRLVNQFGRDRCWLVGDAAHQIGPVGVQSANTGMAEGAALAEALRKVLREKAPLNTLDLLGQKWRQDWRRMLGLSDSLQPGTSTGAWTRQRWQRILPCLPGSHDDLPRLASLVTSIAESRAVAHST